MSLIELMIALAMGLFLLLGLSAFLTANLQSNASSVKLASLDQELRATMTLMVRDIRRAGYWGSSTFNAASGVYAAGALSEIAAGSAAYAASDGSRFSAISYNTSPALPTQSAPATCILYSYDSNGDGSSQSTEQYGFLLNNGAVLMRTGFGASSTWNCTAGTPGSSQPWDYLSDNKNTNITALSFTETDSVPVYMCAPPLPAGCSSGSNMQTRQITISITGQPLNAAGIPDPGITQTLTETVKVENDHFNP